MSKIKKRVLLCGPLPEPIGGISIHLQRLAEVLIKQGWQVDFCDESPYKKEKIFNIRSLNIFRYIRLLRCSDIVHIHSSVHLFRFLHLLSLVLLGKKIIITLHSWRLGRFWTTFWDFLFFHTPCQLVFVTESISDYFRKSKNKSIVKAAFIPDINACNQALPPRMTSFLSKERCTGKKIIVSNAYRLDDYQGVDIYGLDLCVEFFLQSSIYNNYSFIFVVANKQRNDKIASAAKHLAMHDLTNNFLIYEGGVNFSRLLLEADLSIRATCTDGDAISIRESLFFGVPCIASDVVKRPAGTIVFKSRNIESMILAVSSLKQDAGSAKKHFSLNQVDLTEFIPDVY